MEPAKLLEELFDKKTLAVLRYLSTNAEKQFYLRELAKATRVPVATVYRIVLRLVALEVIQVTRIKKMKLYSYGIGKEAKFVEQIIEVRRGAVEEFVDLCRSVDGIMQVVLHGKRQKDKANLLIIGEHVAAPALLDAASRVRESLGFNIIYLVLTPHQYDQMVDMGLYAGDRQVLLERSPVETT